MRCATLLILLCPLPSPAQDKPKAPANYFKVEIRGKLSVVGKHEIVDPQGIGFSATVLGTGLVFGDNKELAALAQKLDGKTVLIHGHLGKWSPLTAVAPSHYITYVRVTELKAVDEKEGVVLPAQEKGTLPEGQPPQFFVVTETSKDGLAIQRRPPPTKEIDVPLIEYKLKLKTLHALDAKGKALTADELAKRLKPGMVVLVSADDEPVSSAFLTVVKEDAVILMGVIPQPRGEGLRPKQ